MSENNSDLGAFLAGFVIGGLVGAATALILAPQSGPETRSQIAHRSNELRSTSSNRLRDYRNRADEYTQDYRERAGNMLTHTRDRVQMASGQVQEQARIVLDSGKEKATQVRQQVSSYRRDDDHSEDTDNSTTA